MIIFFFCFLVNVFLMDVYVEKNLLWSYLIKREGKRLFLLLDICYL